MRICISLEVEFDAVNGNVLDCAANAETRFREAIEEVLWPDEDFIFTSEAEDIEDAPVVKKRRKK